MYVKYGNNTNTSNLKQAETGQGSTINRGQKWRGWGSTFNGMEGAEIISDFSKTSFYKMLGIDHRLQAAG